MELQEDMETKMKERSREVKKKVTIAFWIHLQKCVLQVDWYSNNAGNARFSWEVND